MAKSYEEELESAVADCESLLDVGCGTDSPVQSLSKRRHTVGVDAFEASLAKSRQRRLHNDYVQADVRHLPAHFAPASFDAVVALDLIEHLPKEEGERLLSDMEAIARKKVVVFTPNGFLPQAPRDANPWQAHQSGWTVEEMRRRGYRVIGLRGWKALRGEFADLRFKPKFFWLIVSALTQLWVRGHPEHAFQILCVKEKPALP